MIKNMNRFSPKLLEASPPPPPPPRREGYLSFVILQNEYPDTVKSINWIKSNRPQLNIAYNPSPFKSELILKNYYQK